MLVQKSSNSRSNTFKTNLQSSLHIYKCICGAVSTKVLQILAVFFLMPPQYPTLTYNKGIHRKIEKHQLALQKLGIQSKKKTAIS